MRYKYKFWLKTFCTNRFAQISYLNTWVKHKLPQQLGIVIRCMTILALAVVKTFHYVYLRMLRTHVSFPPPVSPGDSHYIHILPHLSISKANLNFVLPLQLNHCNHTLLQVALLTSNVFSSILD